MLASNATPACPATVTPQTGAINGDVHRAWRTLNGEWRRLTGVPRSVNEDWLDSSD